MLFVYQVSWPRWEECSLVSFSSRSPSVYCDFHHPCLSLSFFLSAPLSMLLFLWSSHSKHWRSFFLVCYFLVNHTWILLRLWTRLPLLHQAGESHPNYLNYWLLWLPGCDLHEVTFSSNMQTFATFFFWKTINSAALSSAPLFLRYTTPSLTSSGYCLLTNRENLQPKEWGMCAEVKLLLFFFSNSIFEVITCLLTGTLAGRYYRCGLEAEWWGGHSGVKIYKWFEMVWILKADSPPKLSTVTISYINGQKLPFTA